MTKELPYAEDINYWKTGQSSPDSWMGKSVRLIQGLDGFVIAEAFGKDASGSSAFMLAFEIEGNEFKVVWPVLPSKSGNEKAARTQAATMLHHDIKAKCISATVLGVRVAFFSYLLLGDGRTTTEFETEGLRPILNNLFGSTDIKQLGIDDIVDGEYSE